ncbi:MAG TPA: hypothetical protein VFQ44_05890 [Streptosporangiaceae bacterium]|nr:hypothetical protein [Streptosporangiaceae bacterium]
MLTHQQILHFRTFGYVPLRGLFGRAEAAALHDEVARDEVPRRLGMAYQAGTGDRRGHVVG